MDLTTTTTTTAAEAHVLVIPCPMEGHIKPMFNFALHLATHGVAITFVNTVETQKRFDDAAETGQRFETRSGHELDVRFATVPGSSLDSFSEEGIKGLVMAMDSQQGLIEEMIVSSRDSLQPITCIVSDFFFGWTQDLASKLGIQRILFWSNCGMSLAAELQMKSSELVIPGNDDYLDEDVEIGGVNMKLSEFVATLPSRDPIFFYYSQKRLDGIEDTTSIVVNTFKELEVASLAASHCETHVRYIGPIMPPKFENGESMEASLYHKETDCLSWLDNQENGSVIYISFGSLIYLAQNHVEELSAAIEESNRPFLWVIRDNTHFIPKTFIERTRDRGLIIKWAPQVQVLGHQSIGAFLTHCGWNSTLESIYHGVPMLCFPFFADQLLNAYLITKVWKNGISIFKEKHVLAPRDEVKEAIMSIMHSDEIRQRARLWKVASHQALEQGGSSNVAMTNVIHDLMTFRKPKVSIECNDNITTNR